MVRSKFSTFYSADSHSAGHCAWIKIWLEEDCTKQNITEIFQNRNKKLDCYMKLVCNKTSQSYALQITAIICTAKDFKREMTHIRL